MMMKKQILSMVVIATALASVSVQAETIPGEVPLKPYAFGTVGVAQDGLKTTNGTFNDRDARVAGQVGVGVQLSEYMGGEIYYQSGDKFKYEGQNGAKDRVLAQTIGTRATIGTSTANKARVFAKLGVAAVNHDSDLKLDSNNRAQFTAGVGATYAVSDNFAVRGDYDHYFKRNSNTDRKGADYVGIGGQVNF